MCITCDRDTLVLGMISLAISGLVEHKVTASLEKSWSSTLKQIQCRIIGDCLYNQREMSNRLVLTHRFKWGSIASKEELTMNEKVLYLYGVVTVWIKWRIWINSLVFLMINRDLLTTNKDQKIIINNWVSNGIFTHNRHVDTPTQTLC